MITLWMTDSRNEYKSRHKKKKLQVYMCAYVWWENEISERWHIYIYICVCVCVDTMLACIYVYMDTATTADNGHQH
jgi:hypothetical protein